MATSKCIGTGSYRGYEYDCWSDGGYVMEMYGEMLYFSSKAELVSFIDSECFDD